jgi:hypothetical protein
MVKLLGELVTLHHHPQLPSESINLFQHGVHLAAGQERIKTAH